MFLVWLKDNVTTYEYTLFKKYALVKSTQLQSQGTKERITFRFPKIPWLDNIESESFRLPNKIEIEEFQQIYRNNTKGWEHRFNTDEVMRLLPKAVSQIYKEFQQSEFYNL